MERLTTAIAFLLLLTGSVAHAATRTTPSDAPAESFAAVVGDHLTEFRTSGRAANRAANVALAAERVDGVVLAPGERFSFNDVVGERTTDAGFLAAPVIANGRIRMGMGGGICQVASTLHVAVLEAGMTIVEHRSHSRPVGYVPTGLDATVAWGQTDYVFQNDHDFPVRVFTKVVDGQLLVRIDGDARAPNEIDADVIRTLEPRTLVEADETLTAGERVVDRAGHEGYVVRVRVTDAEGNTDTSRVRYFPRHELVRVG